MSDAFELAGPPPDLDRLRSLLPDWRVERGDAWAEELVYLDTFDWRLHRKGLRLVRRSGSPAVLELRDAAAADLTLPLDARPRFARDVPAGELRDRLAAAAGPRRLLEVVAVEREGLRAPVRNGLDKLVAHLGLARRTARLPSDRGEPAPAWDPGAAPLGEGTAPAARDDANGAFDASVTLPTLVEIGPLKGFEEEADRIAADLREAVDGAGAAADELLEALGRRHRRPSPHGAKWLPPVAPEQPIGQVVGLFLAALLAAVERNLPGLREDLDPEFLHDVRVAVRRTRSLLRELAKEPPVPALAALEEELAWLGGRTGACRDLDVLSAELGGYVTRLPGDLGDELGPLAARVLRARGRALATLLDDLDSARCGSLLAAWHDRAAEHSTAAEGRPARVVADERIRALASRTLERARDLDEDSPDDEVHRLRIRCKRLRYLLEFFRALYPSETLDPVVETLRRLQDRLGRFQDLCVHAQLLRAAALEPAMPPLDAPALLAAGALFAELDRAKRRERRRIDKALRRFLDDEPDRVAQLVGEAP